MFARLLAEAVPRTEDASGAAGGGFHAPGPLKMRRVPQEAVHSMWSRLFCGPLKTHSVQQVLFCGPLEMRRVPQKGVSGTEFPFCTRNACFLHRVLPKMRRVPQEAFLRTECPFRTIGGRFRYRVPSKEYGKGPQETSSALAGDAGNGGRSRSEQRERSPPPQRQAAAAAELRTSQSRRVRDFHPIGYVRSGRTKKEADLLVDLFFCIGSQQEMITLLKQLL